MRYKNYKIVESWRKNKKFAVLLPYYSIWVHFGDTRYQDYTQHKDKKRRELYLKRASQIRDKNGKLTINDITSPNYWSARVLWRYRK